MIAFDFFGYILFALITSITPGPNNYLLFSHGRNYGFKDSGKLVIGIFLGFFFLLLIAGYGVAELITKIAGLELILKIISSIWLLYMAISVSKITTISSINTKNIVGFYQSFLLQFVNPKAWIMAIGGASAFMPGFANEHISIFVFALLFSTIGIPCMVLWIMFGDLISKWFKSEKSNRIIAFALFVLMIISIITIWL